MNEPIIQLSTRQLLDGSARYLIPMYQRNYAWEEAEISQLIQDVLDAMRDAGESPRDYYLGSLVVDRREDDGCLLFETLDGHQRLTTLSLLMLYLKKHLPKALDWLDAPRIEFENRPRSTATVAAIAAAEGDSDGIEGMQPDEINSGILAGYRLVRELLPRLLADDELSAFAAYLFDHVQIMRVEVPEHTDLNHYFEVMNNRGEQLEKHEVLKARLLEALSNDPAAQACLHQVWEACANMEKYVQMGFAPTQREQLFDNDNGGVKADGFDDLATLLAKARGPAGESADEISLKLTQILALPVSVGEKHPVESDDGAPERFSSVINFPNFLLQVLQVWLGESDGVRLTLDDKQLLPAFERHVLDAEDPAAQVKAFTFALLRCKLLYDHFVIKREFHNATDGWSLKRFKYTQGGNISYVNTFGEDEDDAEANQRILMLLSALHVSAPSQVYKYWMIAALRYLYLQDEPVQAGDYLAYLRSMTRSFVFDRVLAAHDEHADYYDLVYSEQPPRDGFVSNERLSGRLRYGVIENNLVFNYLDYLLWEQHKAADSKIKAFVFTFRSSVEHYYPRNPISERPLSAERLNAFGNLCLISHSKNSRLSNYMPVAKKEHYDQHGIDSIKQYLMMKYEGVWGDEGSIEQHEEAMLNVLRDSAASR